MLRLVRRQYKKIQRLSPGRVVSAAAHVVTIVMLLVSGALVPRNAYAGSSSYDFGVPGDYSFDDVTTEITSNQARLSSQQYATDANTKALWHMDEPSGATASDSSGNSNDLVLDSTGNCAPSFAAGKVNNALSLTGAPDCVTATDSPSLSLSNQITLEAFTKFNSAFDNTNNAIQGVIGKGNYKLYFDRNDGRLKFELDDNTTKTWSKVAGSVSGNGSWDENLPRDITNAVEYNGSLYVATGGILSNAAGLAEVWKYSGSGTTWTKVGGDGVNSSWADNTYEHAPALTVVGSYLFVGMGVTAGDAEVWRYNGTSWLKVGGDGAGASGQASWTTGYETVRSFATDGTYLYAGLGDTNTDSEVWRCNNCSTGITLSSQAQWTKVGGDGLNGAWASGTWEQVVSMVASGTTVYAGLGTTAGDAEVWRCDSCTTSPSWTKVGGDSLNSSWDSTIEEVWSLAVNGTTVYAGLGDTASDADVWMCSSCTTSPSWSQIGGDSANNWNTGYERVYALTLISGTLYAALGITANDAEVWRYSGSGNTWTKVGGDAVNSSWQYSIENSFVGQFGGNLIVGTGGHAEDAEVWTCANCDTSPIWTWIGGRDWNSWGAVSMAQVNAMAINNGKLYVGFRGGNKFAVVWEYNGETDHWQQIAGGTINSSWDESIESVYTLASFKNHLYAGLGDSTGDGQLWEYDNATWHQVGGTSIHNSWSNAYEYAWSLATGKDYLFVGLGSGTDEAEVWRYDGLDTGTSWTKVGDDMAGSWLTTAYNTVRSLMMVGTTLYAGLGDNAGEADVWRCSGCTGGSPTWTKVGGSGVNSSWIAGTYDQVNSLAALGRVIFVGLGVTAGEAEVWRCDSCDTSPSWTLIGGDGLGASASWSDLEFEQVLSMITYNGQLYVGLGNSASDAEVWECDNCDSAVDADAAVWNRVAGDNTNGAWGLNYEAVNNMTVYNGKLYAGTGNTGVGSNSSDGQVWAYGNTHVLASATNSWDTNWHHIAATYNGTTAKIYIDGVESNSATWGSLTLADLDTTLYIGSVTAPFDNSADLVGFNGLIDEVRISNTARNTFTLSQYASTAQVVEPNTTVPRIGVLAWNGFATTETANGGTITYRLSDDDGVTWKYWNGITWTSSPSTSQANSAAVVDANIGSFPVTADGLKWQAILLGNGDQQVTVSSVQITWSDDITAPDNPTVVTAKNQAGGATTLSSGNWYNYASPEFSWPAAEAANGATDNSGSGVEGYYVYFGTSASGDPESGTFQTGTTYVPTNLSNGATYYLRIKTRDNAQNVQATAWDVFTYKFDNDAPDAPLAVSVSPASYTATNAYDFFWPMIGASAPSDADPDGAGPLEASDLVGYEFKTNASSGAYSDWSALQTDTSGLLALPNGTFTDDPAWQEGPNTFFLRYKDNAGNYSNPVSVNFFYAGSAPSAPQNLQVSPTSSEGSPSATNDFSFTWDQPDFFNGSIKQYHYSVNKLPTSTNTSQTTSRTLAAAPYATQQGKNTLYVVAEDEASNINYGIYASIDFYTQTPAPAPPTAVQIFDISNRDAEEYAISMKWLEPDKANGFDGYEIFRSEDNVTYVSAGTSQSPVFIDANLDSQLYYYKVQSKDNAGQYSSDSSVVSITPTGRFTTPPELEEDPSIISKSFSADASWRTDRVASSFVEYGTDKNKIGKEKGGETVGTLDLVEEHAIKLTGLDPETTYYYQAVWVDQDGNQGRSELLSFQTGLRPRISDVSVSNITLTSATISWSSTTVATSEVRYGTSQTLGQTVDDSDNTGTKHTVQLTGLSDTTAYHFVIAGTDVDGNTLASDQYQFSTLTRPIVSNFAIEPVRDAATTTLRFTWETNVPTTSIVAYSPDGGALQSSSNPDYVTAHELIVDQLGENTPYGVQARSVDEYGNTAVSASLSIVTPDDSRPPRIANLTIEVRSSGSSQDQRAQLVINWETDEPSSSQIEYGPGISSDNYASRTQEDQVLTTNHTVIVPELDPAKIYHLRAVSRDRAGNAGISADTTAITGKVQRSVVDIIISSLQSSLGFLTRLPFLSR